MLTSALHLNLSRNDAENDRRCIGQIYALPPGSRVVLFFGARKFWEYETVRQLSEYVATLHLDVQASTWEVAEAWRQAIATGGRQARWSA